MVIKEESHQGREPSRRRNISGHPEQNLNLLDWMVELGIDEPPLVNLKKVDAIVVSENRLRGAYRSCLESVSQSRLLCGRRGMVSLQAYKRRH